MGVGMNRIGRTDLEVFPLCLGGNVFGWTADQGTSFAVLDAYVDAGGNFIDTADSYSAWVDGHSGGESETVIGRWLARSDRRREVVIATKVGRTPGRTGLSAANIRACAEDSLRRLGVDHIDLYYAHADDPGTPLDESLGAFDELVTAGHVRHIAASNYSAPRLAEALAAGRALGVAGYAGLQVHHNLVHRREYEPDLAALCQREGLSCLPYAALADGFLTGKYRPGREIPPGERAEDAAAYLTDHGIGVLDALDTVAGRNDTSVAAVSLAWLLRQPAVAAPVASARNPEQLRALLGAVELTLSRDDLALLDGATTFEPQEA
jgi:aryl-alcohol dehydrogenase-like predicted oxidoreductase